MSGEHTPKKSPRSNLRPPWKPGQSGNPKGRPKGARSKLSEDFFAALSKDFAENGVKAITDMREKDPQSYVRAIASLQTKEVSGEEGTPLVVGVIEYPGLDR